MTASRGLPQRSSALFFCLILQIIPINTAFDFLLEIMHSHAIICRFTVTFNLPMRHREGGAASGPFLAPQVVRLTASD